MERSLIYIRSRTENGNGVQGSTYQMTSRDAYSIYNYGYMLWISQAAWFCSGAVLESKNTLASSKPGAKPPPCPGHLQFNHIYLELQI